MIVIAIAIVTAFMAAQIPKLKVNVSLSYIFSTSNELFREYERFTDEFGDNVPEIVTIRADDIFTPAGLKKIRRLSREIEELPGVQEVLSITDALDIQGEGDLLIIGKLLEEIPTTREEISAFRKRLESHPFYGANLVSKDGKATAVIADLKAAIAHEPHLETSKEIETIVEKFRAESGWTEISQSGTSFVVNHLTDSVLSSLFYIGNLTILIIIVFLFFTFRSFWGIVLPLIMVTIALVWTSGFINLIGGSITTITPFVVAVLLVVGVANAVHIITNYYEEFVLTTRKREAIENTVRILFLPCFLTSLTTSVGFFSLTFSSIRPVQELGIYTSFGVVSVFVITIMLVPVLLYWIREPAPKVRERIVSGLLKDFLVWCSKMIAHHKAVVILAAVLITGISFLGILHIKTGTNILHFFKKSSVIRRSLEFQEENLGGVGSSLILVGTGRADSFRDPETLGRLEKFELSLKEFPEVDWVFSVADYLKLLNQSLLGGAEEEYRLPEDPLAVRQALMLFSMMGGEKALKKLVRKDYSAARVLIRYKNMNSKRSLSFINYVSEQFAQTFGESAELIHTGGDVLVANTMETLTTTQTKSFMIAFGVIMALFMILFRSPVTGALAMIPNIFPVIVATGLMGFLKIPLDFNTVIIGPIIISIAVDDTIHFMHRFRRELILDGDYAASIHRTLIKTGRALTSTTVIIAGGFLANLASFLLSSIHMGILSAVAVIFALAADLLILPVVLSIFRPVKIGMNENKGG